jgi:WD40 repeat protein
VPATSVGCLKRPNTNIFVVAFLNGTVKLFNSETGALVGEVGAHSRQINGLVCHPTKSVFATCSDDTFLNVWEVQGDEIEIDVVISSRVADFILTGVCFADPNHSSLICTVYDYKQMIVWNNIL